jgi:glycosyltransferase involved in cell wall biosynthesis
MGLILDTGETDRAISISSAKMDVRHIVIDTRYPLELRSNGTYLAAKNIAREQFSAGEDAKLIFLREAHRTICDEDDEHFVRVLTLAGRTVLGRRVSINTDVLDTITAGGSARIFFHIHGARNPALWSLILRLREKAIPYAMTIHGHYSHLFDRTDSVRRYLSAFYLRHVERHILERACFVQALTEAECKFIRRIAPRARVELVSNGAYSSRLEGKPPPPQRASPSANFPIFGYLGRYSVEHKGLDLLIAGFTRYRRAGGIGRLELVGTGSARDQIAAEVHKLGIAEFVDVCGPRFGEEKARTLAAWDYFVMPSRFEGVPLGAIEAALAGLPLIVTAETGLLRPVNNFGAGVAIESLSPEAILHSLLQAESLNAVQWAQMSDASYRMAVSIGDWTSIAAKLVSLYRGC